MKESVSVDQCRLPVPFLLRQGLAAAGVSQRQLAKRMGVSQNYISRLANGHSTPSWRTAVLIAEAAGVSLDLFREPPEDHELAQPKKRRRRKPAAEKEGPF